MGKKQTGTRETIKTAGGSREGSGGWTVLSVREGVEEAFHLSLPDTFSFIFHSC